jgi:hypothetical protein
LLQAHSTSRSRLAALAMRMSRSSHLNGSPLIAA